MGRFDRFCQSCGMPMDKDTGGGGTEADGTKSEKYCSLCYKDGQFVDDFTSSGQMVDFVKKVMHDQGHNKMMCWFYTSQIKKFYTMKIQGIFLLETDGEINQVTYLAI